MLCDKCGIQITDGIKFCPNCGEKIGQTDSGKLTEKNKGRKRRKTLILIVFALVITIVLAVCLVLRTKEKSTEDGRNEDGQQSEMNINSEDEQQTEMDVIQEDKKAVLKSEESQFENGVVRERYEYDIYGNQTFYQGYGSNDEYEYEYSVNGLPITAQHTGSTIGTEKATHKLVYTYEYNEIDKPVFCVKERYDENGNYLNKTEITYVYEENGINLEKYEIYYDSDGQIFEKNIYEWDDKKEKWHVTYSYQEYGVAEEIYYTYNENGDLIREEVYRFGEIYQIETHEYVYDDDGNIMGEIDIWHYDYPNIPDEKVIRNIYYEYDVIGNLSVKYVYGEEGDLDYVTYYTYYD